MKSAMSCRNELRRWLLLAAAGSGLWLVASCSGDEASSRSSNGAASGGSSSGGSGANNPGTAGTVTGTGAAPGAAGQVAVQTDSGAYVVPETNTGSYDEYAPSCEAQQCTIDEQCFNGPQGTYCVHPCPGQPCPHDGETAFCTRTGGVICAAP